jgi:hypothetical protein
MLTMEYCLVFFPVPVDDTFIELQSVLSIRRLPSALATRLLWKKTVAEVGAVIEQDVPVWESKQFKARPVLVPEDGPIHAYRSWTRQFYPKAKPRDAKGRADRAEVSDSAEVSDTSARGV